MGKVAAFMVAKGAKVVAVNAASAYQARLMEATVYYNILDINCYIMYNISRWNDR